MKEKMSEIVRFGVSMEKELVKKFDSFIKEKKFPNRSEAIRHLIREEIVKKEWEENKEIAGCITLVYDHHKREILNKITEVQHNFNYLIISTQHIHLDHHNCFEIIAVKGKAEGVKKLYNLLSAIKGIKHSGFSYSTTGKELV
jgi:CopG family nickel-responsive transcriptional regulator